MHPLLRRRAWVFDLDGTLTLAIHDFDAIRAELGLPPGGLILEALERLPLPERAPRLERLAEIERRLATQAAPAPGAPALLDRLHAEGATLGILTRNTRANALLTLEAVGLLPFFPEASILGRDEAPPKPSPAGVLAHLARWGRRQQEAVMVGDFELDLRAGRGAGVATVYVDPDGAFPYRAWADVAVRRLDELLAPAGG